MICRWQRCGPEPGLDRTRSSAPSPRAGWGRCTGRGIPRLQRDVAIKLLPATYSGDAKRLRRFELEARAAGQLAHPNIPAIYDIGTFKGSPYVVSELLEGETLRQRMRRGKALAPRKATEIALQIARGPVGGEGDGARTPGSEAREHLPDQGRPGEDPRLRPGEAGTAGGEEREDRSLLSPRSPRKG